MSVCVCVCVWPTCVLHIFTIIVMNENDWEARPKRTHRSWMTERDAQFIHKSMRELTKNNAAAAALEALLWCAINRVFLCVWWLHKTYIFTNTYQHMSTCGLSEGRRYAIVLCVCVCCCFVVHLLHLYMCLSFSHNFTCFSSIISFNSPSTYGHPVKCIPIHRSMLRFYFWCVCVFRV